MKPSLILIVFAVLFAYALVSEDDSSIQAISHLNSSQPRQIRLDSDVGLFIQEGVDQQLSKYTPPVRVCELISSNTLQQLSSCNGPFSTEEKTFATGGSCTLLNSKNGSLLNVYIYKASPHRQPPLAQDNSATGFASIKLAGYEAAYLAEDINELYGFLPDHSVYIQIVNGHDELQPCIKQISADIAAGLLKDANLFSYRGHSPNPRLH